MADIRNKTASIYIDDTAAQAALTNLQQKADGLNKSIDETRKRQKALTDEIARAKAAGENYSKQSKELSKLNTELGKGSKALVDNTAKQKALQQQIDTKTGPSLKQQQALVNKLVNEFKNLGSNSEAAASKLKEIESASKSLTVLRDRLASVQQVQKQTVSESGGFGKIFERVAEYTGAYAIISKVTEGLHELVVGSVEEAMQAEESTARFKATLDNLGKTDVFDRLKTEADEMAAKFKYIDNDEIVAVFEKLIDYGKLTEEQINHLTPVIINFAAKQRIPITEATDVITKALEGNGKALKTYGINLTEAATPAERLKIIMTELKDKVDGASDAFANTTAGKIAIAKQSFKDLQEEIGNNLLPALNKVMEFVNDSIKGIPMLFNDLKDLFNYGTIGITNSINQMKKSDALQASNVDKAAANQKIKEIQIVLDTKVVNKKTGKPFTKDDVLQDLQNQIGTAKNDRDKAMYQQILLHFDTKTLGNGDPNFDPKADAAAKKEAARKRAEEQKKIIDDQKKLDEELLKLQHEYEGKVESEYMKELQAAFDKYDKLKELAHGKKEELKKIEVGFNQAIAKINAEYAQKAIDDLKKLDDEKRKLREKQLQDQLKKGFEFLNAVGADVAKDADRKNQLRKAQDDYDIAHASGKKLFELELKQLDDEEALAVAAAIKRGDSVEAVELEFQKKREELQAGRFEKEVELYLGFAQQVLSILNTFDEGRRNKEAAELGRIQKTHDTEKASYQRMLNSKAISKQQFDKKVAELDAQADKKRQEIEKQQFERNKKIQLAQALVNGALGITSVLAARPGAVDVISLGAFRAINIALTVAATAAQVAAIARSKYEGGAKYAKGGALNGPSHKDGGMPVINPRTGRKEAEVEGGEVILSRKTVSNNKGLVDALLYSSMHKEGARIDPWFKNRTYKAIDFSGISRSIQNVRHYASGGVFTSNASDTPQAPTPSAVILPPGFEALPDLLQAVANRLAVTPKAYVVYQDIKDAETTVSSIKNDATFGKK
jgi:hypothetical protein